jgi:peroxiredoxin
MHPTPGAGDQARLGDAFPTLELAATSGQLVTIPDPAGNFVHLQLRPSLDARSATFTCARSSRAMTRSAPTAWEVVVFRSTAAELAKHAAELPFQLIADPERELYRRLGVERRPGSLLSTHALRAATAGQAAALGTRSTKRGPLGPEVASAASRLPDRSRRAGRCAQVRTARVRPVDGRRTPRPRPSRARVNPANRASSSTGVPSAIGNGVVTTPPLPKAGSRAPEVVNRASAKSFPLWPTAR